MRCGPFASLVEMTQTILWSVAAALVFGGLLVFGLVWTRRARAAFKRHLKKLADELGLAPGMNQADYYFGTIQGWPVRLSIENAAGLSPKLLAALFALNVIDAVDVVLLTRVRQKLAVLEISGQERPQELDQLVAKSGSWRTDLAPWKLLIAGDNTIRWVQRLHPEQKELAGEHVLSLLAMTLSLDRPA